MGLRLVYAQCASENVRDGESNELPVLQTGYPLELQHAVEIDARLVALREKMGMACLSDLAFSNMYLFREVHAYRYLPGPYPCVAGVTYDGTRHFLPLFDIASAPYDAMAELLDGYDCFFPVSKDTAFRLDRNLFTIDASADDADYLYPAENFRSYRGEVLRKKRNLMQQLLAATEVQAHPLTQERKADALGILARWMEGKGKAAGEADEQACREALNLSERFGFDGTVYYAAGEPIGFLIAQSLNAAVTVMRFAKGIDSHKGIYQYMFHHYCMNASGVEWFNFEQDLGLANFRQTKRSYQPCAMLDKFRVRIRR